MRWIAWLLLACGPLLAAPAAAGVWTRARLAGVHGAELYGLSAAAGAMLAEGLLISVRGLVRSHRLPALRTVGDVAVVRHDRRGL